jgi:hypothetical protein
LAEARTISLMAVMMVLGMRIFPPQSHGHRGKDGILLDNRLGVSFGHRLPERGF